jgi:Fe-S cluster assembly ATP-binding protein
MLSRSVNEGFSGGEKKRYEILQMSILKPHLSILDETDSGLDVDALKTVTDGVKNIKNSTSSFLIITHYLRLLDYIKPDFVHVMHKGRIIKSGDKSLAKEIDLSGYKNL